MHSASQVRTLGRMSLHLTGRLARRRGPAGDRCPIDRTVQLVGQRSTILLMREALYGTTRFDDLVRLSGLSEAVAAKRLRELVEHDLLERRPYQESGQRTRFEYLPTERGRDLLPALLALAQWGNEHAPRKDSPRPRHDGGCEAAVEVVLRCTAGHLVPEDELAIG